MLRLLLIVIFLAALADGKVALTAQAEATPDFQVIVNPGNPIVEVERDMLRLAYLKKSTEWARGGTIRPIDLARRYPVRDRFTREVVRKTPSQLKSYWSQQIFSGKGVPPPEADSPSAVISYVLAHEGAVGYLPANIETRGVKVVKVK